MEELYNRDHRKESYYDSFNNTQQYYEEEVYTEPLGALFLCTENLSINSRNVKDFNRIKVVKKFVVSECTKFNGHAGMK